MSDLIFITCPDCDTDCTLDLYDDLICPYCGADMSGISFVISNIDLDDDDSY